MADQDASKDKGKEGEGEEPMVVSESQVLKINAKGRPFDAALYGETVQKGFAKMYSDPLLSDVTLVLGQEKISAHKMVLCAWSETFRSMLSNEMEWKESQLKELPINIEEEDYEHFKHMLRYMYTGSVDFLTAENIIPMIRLSDYYGILSLKEICGELLGEQLSEDNLFFLLDIVERFDCRRLNTHCGEFLAAHFGEMWEETPERLLSLKVDTWIAMLKSNELQARSEEVIYEAVLRYANQVGEDDPKRDETLVALLPHIRFSYLRPRFLVETVENDQSVMRLPLMTNLLYETYRYRMYPKSKVSFSTQPRTGFQRFDRERCSSVLVLSEDELKVTLSTSSGWNNVRCACPYSESYTYCEFKVVAGPNVMIGVVDGDCSRNGYAGQYANGWTYYSQGGMYHAGGTPSTGQRFVVGDRIGVEVLVGEGKVNFYKNGQLSTSATNIPRSNSLYPIVCCSALGDSVSIVAGVHKPEQAPPPAPKAKKLTKAQRKAARKKKSVSFASSSSSSSSSASKKEEDDDMGGLFGGEED
jgi:hypothetical protein